MKGKSELRKEINILRKALTKDKKVEMDNIIFNNFINSKYYNNSTTIFTYVSYLNEVDTHRLIKFALNDKKVVCVPKIISKEKGMKAVVIEKFNDLKEGQYNILEPFSFDNTIDEKKIDISIIPGVAFDIYGGRVGYGGGFYDKFLIKLTDESHKIAFSYGFQVFNEVPVEEHDIKIDGIITEEKIILI